MTDYKQLAQEHGVSEDAVRHLHQALQRGNGTMAQFNHPDLGGSGQWMPGMTMIGDMFNTALKARIEALVAALLAVPPATPAVTPMPTIASWWDTTLGAPAQMGEQNNYAYAYFPRADVVEIRHGRTVSRYNTTGHTLTGVQQQQTTTWQQLRFTTPSGLSVALTDFEHIADRPLA